MKPSKKVDRLVYQEALRKREKIIAKLRDEVKVLNNQFNELMDIEDKQLKYETEMNTRVTDLERRISKLEEVYKRIESAPQLSTNGCKHLMGKGKKFHKAKLVCMTDI